MTAWRAGFGIGLSLIVAIGAQNAFVLRQGLLGRHVWAVVLICVLSDAALIVFGVTGFAHLTNRFPGLDMVLRLGGALFLVLFGAMSLRSAWRGDSVLEAAGQTVSGLGRTIGVCMALTWGNPHVYVDTVLLLGAVSADFEDKRAFAIGAITASTLFFILLGFGARWLRGLFRTARSWQILDVVVALIMWAIAARLLFWS
ncbi:LysE/ArgO family amino acid transporter [Pseudooceanicola algae]|nr:LysE/ArgO family amino acid transporter [Pseudooceanicola algae]